jgi:hypothetical protein
MKFKLRLSVLIIALITAFSPLGAAQKSVNLKIFPEAYTLSVDGAQVNPQKVTQYLKRITVQTGEREFLIKSEGYLDKKVKINITGRTSELEIKLEKKNSMIEQVAVFQTGAHPKSVEFTPDG